MLQNFGSNHQPIPLTALLSPVFYPNKRHPFFNFQKARWDDFAFYFDSHCSFLEEYLFVSLSSAALFISLTLNAAKSFVSLGSFNLKSGGSLKWKKRLVKDVRLSLLLIDLITIVRLTSLLPNMPRLSSPKPKLRHGRQLALLSRPNLTLNLCTVSCILLLTLLSYLSPFLAFPTVLLQGVGFVNYLRSHFSVSLPKAVRSRSRGYLFELR